MVSISFCFKRCLYKASFSEYRTASKRLGEVLDEHPYILYSRRNSPVFDIISKLLGELPLVCPYPFLLLFRSNFESSLFFRFSAPLAHWPILINFPWLLLPSFNSHQGLSARRSRILLDPTRIFVRVF